jgi:hypothetical protein
MIRRVAPVALALAAAFLALGTATAQSFPPMRFFGSITIEGQPAPAGTTLRAFIGNAECGSTTLSSAGTYSIDVLHAGIPDANTNCRLEGNPVVSFRVDGRTAAQTRPYRLGGFEQLDLTFGGGVPTAPFNGAALNLESPCIPEGGAARCSAEEEALWNADRDAWARRGITDQPPFVPFEGRVFEATVIRRVELGDPGTIRNIARILGNPFLQVTQVRFRGTEYVEVTNLGGGGQTMDGWSIRSETTGQRFNFPAFTMAPGQICRIYSGPAPADSCGNLSLSFNAATVWPDDSGRIVLNYDALNLLGDDVIYRADPASQPPPPNLSGIDLP